MTCAKVKYATWEEARRVLAWMRKKNPSYRGAEVYKCPDCRGYHIGHSGR